jgi:nucleobase:cation symporter-1, NCS1 family
MTDTGSPRATDKILPDGRVELENAEALQGSPLYNEDLAPVPVDKRNWTTYNFAALWASMSACIPTYKLSSGLIAVGMNWWQAILTILLGNVIVLAPILLNSHPGTKYGIPFPVFARASYGTFGSNLPAIMRAIVACGWFGIQAWIGGQALQLLLMQIIPNWATLLGGPSLDKHTPTEWISFLLFWSLNILVIYRGMNLVKRIQGIAAPFVLLMTAAMLVWAINAANGLGSLMKETGKFTTLHEFLPVFVPSLTAMIGFWATLSLNMPDFTRFGRSQREQTIGQSVALPIAMTLFSGMGVFITSAAIVIYPTASLNDLWDPVKLIGRFNEPWVVAIAMFTVVVATLAVNIAANVVSPANDFANAFPKHISFQRGGLITGVLGIVMCPWKWVDDPSGYIFAWLLGYSGGLGSIAGVLIVDYWLVRRKELKLVDLYTTSPSEYSYSGGWNMTAVIATIVGCAGAWCGLVLPALRPLYDYAWFVGLFLAGFVYWLMMREKTPGNLSAATK